MNLAIRHTYFSCGVCKKVYIRKKFLSYHLLHVHQLVDGNGSNASSLVRSLSLTCASPSTSTARNHQVDIGACVLSRSDLTQRSAPKKLNIFSRELHKAKLKIEELKSQNKEKSRLLLIQSNFAKLEPFPPIILESDKRQAKDENEEIFRGLEDFSLDLTTQERVQEEDKQMKKWKMLYKNSRNDCVCGMKVKNSQKQEHLSSIEHRKTFLFYTCFFCKQNLN